MKIKTNVESFHRIAKESINSAMKRIVVEFASSNPTEDDLMALYDQIHHVMMSNDLGELQFSVMFQRDRRSIILVPKRTIDAFALQYLAS